MDFSSFDSFSAVTTPDHCPIAYKAESLADFFKRLDAWKAEGNWVPASGGTEVPFLTRSGKTLLYCYQPRSGRHAYLDVGSDVILTDEEARAYLLTY